uniref:Peptidase A1 domain-containing protein n=1 Tax=Panagrolaimus davidi TaxID=227884 RepID=A0A914RCH2_9BILA
MVKFDTATSNFWVPDISACNTNTNCPSYCVDSNFCTFLCDTSCCSSPKDGCPTYLFNSTKSSTYVSTEKNITVGAMQCILGEDIVRFGNFGSLQLIIPKTQFAQAPINTDFWNDAINGVMGLGFQENADGNVVPPMINAINKNLLAKPLFTVYLKKVGLQQDVIGGVITYGDVDTVHCSSDFSYHPLTSTKLFQFQLDSVSVGNFTSSTKWNVIADTGTSFIGGPKVIIKSIAQQLGGIYNEDYGIYNVDCNSTIGPLTFTIGGIQYPVEQEQLIIDLDTGNCGLTFFRYESGGSGPTWIFGYSWFRSYCSVFNLGQKNIGFAKPIF